VIIFLVFALSTFLCLLITLVISLLNLINFIIYKFLIPHYYSNHTIHPPSSVYIAITDPTFGIRAR
jgi:hypothetical protein